MSEKVEIIPEREDDWYMDPVSGNVQTLEKWREEQGLDELSGWCNEDMSIFVPVIKDKYGDWVNLEPDSVVAANRVIPAAAIADLKQMQGNERAEKILDMLQHSSVVPED
ncbi:hypothetical protein HAP94_19425 [Acidithiobacillus ferrivorans]|nr:hypothetical protein [Acidithiobacillus ferrivorans]